MFYGWPKDERKEARTNVLRLWETWAYDQRGCGRPESVVNDQVEDHEHVVDSIEEAIEVILVNKGVMKIGIMVPMSNEEVI